MKLYHYANQHFDMLKTKRMQGIDVQGREYKDLGNYLDHISFFLEPIPADILGTIYEGTNHAVWYTGNVVQQYTVDVGRMPDFKYLLTEDPYTTDWYYREWFRDGIPLPDDVTKFRKWMDDRHEYRIKHGLIGYDRHQFIKVATPLIGLTRSKYIELPTRPDWVENQDKYAPCVPHVMLFPEGGIVHYESCKSVRIGNRPLPPKR